MSMRAIMTATTEAAPFAVGPGTEAWSGEPSAQVSAQPLTLLELVSAVSEFASSEEEVVATVAHLINSRAVTLVGNFRGADVRVG